MAYLCVLSLKIYRQDRSGKENDSTGDAHSLQKVVNLIHITRLSSVSKHHASNDNPSLNSWMTHRGELFNRSFPDSN